MSAPLWMHCVRCHNVVRVFVIRKPTSKDVGKNFYKCKREAGGCGHYHVSPDISTAVTNPDTLAGSADGPGSVVVPPAPKRGSAAAPTRVQQERAAFEAPPLPEFSTTIPTQDLQFLWMVQEWERATKGAISGEVHTGDVSSLAPPPKS
jgi:hypothetical protein